MPPKSSLSPSAQADLLKRCGIAHPDEFAYQGESPLFGHVYGGARSFGLEPTVFKATENASKPVDGHLRFEGPLPYAGLVAYDSTLRLYFLFTHTIVVPRRSPPVARAGSASTAFDSFILHSVCVLPALVEYQLAQEEKFFDTVFRYASHNGFRPVSILPLRGHPRVGIVTKDAYLRLERNGTVGVITSEGSLPEYRFYAPK